MANPFFTSATRYPLTSKPLTSPDDKFTHRDLFNITITIQSFLRDLDTLFLGSTLATAPPQEDWDEIGTGADFYGDTTEQTIFAEAGTSGTNIIAKVRALPEEPFKIRALVHSQFPPKDNLGAGICLRNEASGELIIFGVLDGELQVARYTDETTPFAVYESLPFNPQPAQWYKILIEGTQLTFFYSGDGDSWIEFHTRTSSTTWDQGGFWASNENATVPELALTVKLFSWRVEEP